MAVAVLISHQTSDTADGCFYYHLANMEITALHSRFSSLTQATGISLSRSEVGKLGFLLLFLGIVWGLLSKSLSFQPSAFLVWLERSFLLGLFCLCLSCRWGRGLLVCFCLCFKSGICKAKRKLRELPCLVILEPVFLNLSALSLPVIFSFFFLLLIYYFHKFQLYLIGKLGIMELFQF